MSLYAPYKAIGMVTDGNPFIVNRLGEETFLMTSIGSMFQVYRLDHLTLCLVSQSILGKSQRDEGSNTQQQDRITCIQALGTETFAAVGSTILVFDRTRIVRTYNVHQQGVKILGLVLVGRLMLSFDDTNVVIIIDVKERAMVSKIESTLQNSATISAISHPSTYLNKFVFGYSNGQMELWNINKRSLIYTFQSQVGFFKHESGSSDNMPAITCLEQSPACDVLGVGFASGHILLINLKLDRVLFSFRQEGGVTSLSFRTDAAVFPLLASGSVDGRVHIWNLGAKSDADEESEDDTDDEYASNSRRRGERLERKLQSTIEECHIGAVSRVYFLHGEPILITASKDNSLKVWIFDSSDGTARLLRHREGHSGHPLRMKYYGGTTNVSMRENATAESCELLSCGSDGTIRLFNTAIDAQNRALSQKPILKKLGMVRRSERLAVCTGMDFSEARQRDWSNLVTIHKNHSNAYLWNYKNRVVSEMILRQPDWHNNAMMYSVDRTIHSTAVAMTTCGNFALVGSRGGMIYVYNVQSGMPRGSFPSNDSLKKQSGTIKIRAATPGNVLYEKNKIIDEGKFSGTGSLNPKIVSVPAVSSAADNADVLIISHSQEVRGIFIDMTNCTMVSCSLDGQLIFWDFASRKAQRAISFNTPLLFLRGFADSNIVAVAGQDRVVRIVDVNSQKLSRRFGGHEREITDVAFSPDGRRVLSSCVDGTVRVYDMPTGRCLSWLAFGSPVLSIAMSLSGEHLCVAQAGKEGIFMYIDRSLYESVQVWREPTAPMAVEDSVATVDAPNGVWGLGGEKEAMEQIQDNDSDDEGADNGEIKPVQGQVETGRPRESTAQLGQGVITMSALPKAYWTSLFNLEAIKNRNKPKLPPAPAPQAPFFLPTIVRGGSAPSFPTPEEYAQLTTTLAATTSAPGPHLQEVDRVSDMGSDKKRRADDVSSSTKSSKTARTETVDSSSDSSTHKAAEEARIVAELAAMGTAWEEGADDDWGDDDEPSADKSFKDKVPIGVDVVPPMNVGTGSRQVTALVDRRPQSHLINRKTALPRFVLILFYILITHGFLISSISFSSITPLVPFFPLPVTDSDTMPVALISQITTLHQHPLQYHSDAS